jgi:hypothetical protein
MGGSDGWGRSGPPRYSLDELQDRAQRRTDRATYETGVEQVLQDTLRNFNDRDVEGINAHLKTIRDALSKEIEGAVQLLFGGSVSKHTYVNGLSDVDMLVGFNDSSLADKSPDEVMAYFEQRLRDRLPNTEIRRGDLAVTVTFSDGHEIQLLPAVRTDSGYRVATPSGSEWSNVIAPARFAQKLTDVNQAQGGKVVPVVKLYKALNESLPKQSRLSGYHIESLAIEAFEHYNGRQTMKEMLTHFCAQARTGVLTPIVDSTGQTRHIDDYLGKSDSTERRRASSAIANLQRKIERADALESTDMWKEMLS